MSVCASAAETGGNDLWGPEAKSVLHRYTHLLAAVDREQAYDDASPIVARFFPEGFDEAIANANRAAKEAQAEIDARVASGAWVWGK